MATFRKRGSKWQAQIRRKDLPLLSKSFINKSDAEKWVRLKEAEIDRGEFPIGYKQQNNDIRLSELIERYLKEVTPNKKSSKIETYRLGKILRHPIANTALQHLSSSQIASYRDERLNEVGADAVRRDISTLGHILKIAMQEWEAPLKVNPVDNVRKPKPSPARERRLIKGELRALSEASGIGFPHYMLPVDPTGNRNRYETC